MRRVGSRCQWLKHLLLGFLGAGLGCTGAGPAHPEKHFEPWPVEMPLTDRNLVACPLTQQARNGAIIEATIMNYHFRTQYEELRKDGTIRRLSSPIPKAELLPAGVNLVERLARRHEPGQELWLFVQTARDIPLDPVAMAASSMKRNQLNHERIHAVEELVAALRPDLQGRVKVIDVDEAGMPGTEAAKGQLGMIDNTHGVLRPDTYDPRSGGLSASSPSGPIAPPPSPPDPGSAPTGLNPGN
jgi:hypothetical protein